MAGGSSKGDGSKTLPRTSLTGNNNNGTLNNTRKTNWIGALAKLAFILSLFVGWAAYTKPQLKTQLQERFQLLLKDKNLYAFVFSSNAKKSQENKADDDVDIFHVVEKNVEHYPIDHRFFEAFYNTKGWRETGDIVIEWEEAFKKQFQQSYHVTAEYTMHERYDHTTKKRVTIEIPDTDHDTEDDDHNNNNNGNVDELYNIEGLL